VTDTLVARLRAVGCVFAEEEAAEIRRVGGDPDAIVAARAAGVPLEQALGIAVFAGLDLEIGAGVFVPRRRAEVLVDAAVGARPDARIVVDLGCGSGAIGAALAIRLPGAEAYAVDIDRDALAYAVRNGERYGFTVREGDWWDALPRQLRARVDLAVAYLPHVPMSRLADIPDDFRRHEPEHTVAGGADGLDPLRVVLRDLDDWLSPDGLLVTLVAHEQLPAAKRLTAGRRVLLVEG
jgi:release factor glutamine methyltransferase